MTVLMICKKCSGQCEIVPTAYGSRANCYACGIRWTHIRGHDGDWYPEKR